MILTADLGTSVTKVVVWGPRGVEAAARVPLHTTHPGVGRAEQDPAGWWEALVGACAGARDASPEAFAAVRAVCSAASRGSVATVGSDGVAHGPALLWSDRRAGAEAAALSRRLGGGEAVRQRTGVPLDGGAVAAKLSWLSAHEPGRLTDSSWVLSPRDLVNWRLSGAVTTDTTLAARTGLYDLDGVLVPELSSPHAHLLPPVVGPGTVVGELQRAPAAELGLRAGIPVVAGAGDRQCEVLGTGASRRRPMVSWGTTANVSLPLEERPGRVPDGVVLSRGAREGWVLEGGLSAAGSFVAWLGRLLGRQPAELVALAAQSPPGARGVVAVPWLDGARAPWWCAEAGAAFVGLGSAHGPADLARAAIESVARDAARCLASVGGPVGQRATGLGLAGSAAGDHLWVDVLTATTGLPAQGRRSGEAASAGAALLAGEAVGEPYDLDALDPVDFAVAPEPGTVTAYGDLARRDDTVAGNLITLARSLGPVTPPEPVMP